MAETFTFIPSFTSDVDEKIRVKSVQFGDGYRQDSKDGINVSSGMFNLLFDKRKEEEIEDIVDFLRARGGTEHFLWTPDIAGWKTQIKVKCVQWKTRPNEHNSNDLTCIFEQVFTSA